MTISGEYPYNCFIILSENDLQYIINGNCKRGDDKNAYDDNSKND